MMIQGTAHKYGDNIDTDGIIPARYLSTSDPQELAKHCMEDVDPDFVNKMTVGDMIVGGKNFGCGSSREHAPLAIQACGVSCVIAASFGRIFFRNAINIGLPIAQSAEAAEAISDGDRLRVDLSAGTIENITKDECYAITPFPPFMQELLEMGGLAAYTKEIMRRDQHV